MWLTLVVFIVIASLTIGLPVLYYLVAGASAERTLGSMRLWLVANNTTVMVTLFVIFGFVLIGKGLSGLD
jgi:Sap, sulfolipid-1-addressing protein